MKAIFWDFDGTLVDTRQKNYNVTRKIIADYTGKHPDEFDILKSANDYTRVIEKCTNWRHIYQEHFALDVEQTDQIGRLWTPYQKVDNTRTPLFKGVKDVLNSLSFIPQAIISQNSSENIYTILKKHKIEHFFKLIIGYEEVDISRQKPEPDGILKGIKILGMNNYKTIFYVGDHDTDVRCCVNANKALKTNHWPVKILTIGAIYGNNKNHSGWQAEPDYYANKISDIVEIVSDSG